MLIFLPVESGIMRQFVFFRMNLRQAFLDKRKTLHFKKKIILLLGVMFKTEKFHDKLSSITTVV